MPVLVKSEAAITFPLSQESTGRLDNALLVKTGKRMKFQVTGISQDKKTLMKYKGNSYVSGEYMSNFYSK